jgi:hypothetical protein
MYIYTFDYQLNSDDGIIGYGNLQISYQKKMNHDDFEDARLQILNRAKRDYKTDPRNRRNQILTKCKCPITSVSILNVWESIN